MVVMARGQSLNLEMNRKFWSSKSADINGSANWIIKDELIELRINSPTRKIDYIQKY